MSNCKFEEAFCSKIKRTIDINEISIMYKLDPAKYKSISGSLYCPECRKAKLSFVNSNKKYFRTFKASVHTENCSLKQDEMSAKVITKFIEDTKNSAAVVRQIESALATLFPEELKTVTADPNKNEFTKTKTVPPVGLDYKQKKRIPRKRIDLTFSDEDLDNPKIFYGNVRAVWGKDKYNYTILLYSLKKSDLLCKIKITENVYKYIPKEYKSKKDFNCAISFLAVLKNSNENYFKTSLRHSNYIKIISIY